MIIMKNRTSDRNSTLSGSAAPSLSREEARQVDDIAINQYRMPSIVLMENAGFGAARIIKEQAPSGKITILCGSGNNAGDGYVIARHLQNYDMNAEVVSLVSEARLSGDSKTNFLIAKAAGIPIFFPECANSLSDRLSSSSVIIDALLGTGATGSPRGLFADAIVMANHLAAYRFAIDLPSGLDCDSGIASEPTFSAHHTITFVAEKIGFKKNNANKYVGVTSIVDIGVPRKLLDNLLLSRDCRGQS